jgi:6-methylsalicylate decarboxylase
VLKADGIAILTSYDDKYPGDPAFAPLFDELNRRRSIVFVHPTDSTCCMSTIPGLSEAQEEYLFNTTRAITSLLVSGTFSRCPNIRFIFTHAGGTMPMAAGRLVRNLATPLVAAKIPPSLFTHGALDDLQRQYYDVTTATSAPVLAALTRFARPENILFGTDFPYVPMAETALGLQAAGLDPAVLAAIQSGNARRLLPRAR